MDGRRGVCVFVRQKGCVAQQRPKGKANRKAEAERQIESRKKDRKKTGQAKEEKRQPGCDSKCQGLSAPG